MFPSSLRVSTCVIKYLPYCAIRKREEVAEEAGEDKTKKKKQDQKHSIIQVSRIYLYSYPSFLFSSPMDSEF